MSAIDRLKPESLTRRKGEGARGKPVLTQAEKQRRYRAKLGFRTINAALSPEIAAGLIYLRREWGMKSDREAVEAAVRFLTLCTRQGLTRLPQSIDD